MPEIAAVLPGVGGGSRPWSFSTSSVRSTAAVTLHGHLDQQCIDGLAGVLLALIGDEANQTLVVDLRGVSSQDPLVDSLFRVASRWAHCAGVTLEIRSSALSIR